MTDGGVDYSFECIGNVSIMRAALECCHKVTSSKICFRIMQCHNPAFEDAEILVCLVGVGNISHRGCRSIWSRNLNPPISAGDRSCLEGHSFWWFQEPFSCPLACRQVYEESKFINFPKPAIFFFLSVTFLQFSNSISCPPYRKSRLMNTSLTI